MSRLQSLKIRAGVSMIEVLVSMFILSIGLLSIASLLPVGQSQVAQADIQERSSMVGQNAFRSFLVRGYSNPLFWASYRTYPTPPPPSGLRSTVNSVAIQPVFVEIDTTVTPITIKPKPIFIDPMMMTGASPYYYVPHNRPFATKLFDRFTIRTNPTLAVPPGPGPPPLLTAADVLSIFGAESAFIGQDDLTNEPRYDAEQPPYASVDRIGGVITRRQFEGNYSWIAMLMPKSSNTPPPYSVGQPYPGQECELSIVVFYRRSPAITTNSAGSMTERVLDVSAFGSGGVNGGEVTLTIPTTPVAGSTNDILISPGGWLLLYGERLITVSPDPPPPPGAPTHYTAAKWYKILSAERVDPAAPPATRQVTLAGPDWDVNTFPAGMVSPTGKMSAIIFDDSVNVYTKSIRLEGQSSWSAWDGL